MNSPLVAVQVKHQWQLYIDGKIATFGWSGVDQKSALIVASFEIAFELHVVIPTTDGVGPGHVVVVCFVGQHACHVVGTGDSEREGQCGVVACGNLQRGEFLRRRSPCVAIVMILDGNAAAIRVDQLEIAGYVLQLHHLVLIACGVGVLVTVENEIMAVYPMFQRYGDRASVILVVVAVVNTLLFSWVISYFYLNFLIQLRRVVSGIL